MPAFQLDYVSFISRWSTALVLCPRKSISTVLRPFSALTC